MAERPGECRLTQRASGLGYAPRFMSIFLACGWFRQSSVISPHLVVEPVETHQQVTLTVSRHSHRQVYLSRGSHADERESYQVTPGEAILSRH